MQTRPKIPVFYEIINRNISQRARKKVVSVLFTITVMIASLALGFSVLETVPSYQIGQIAEKDVRVPFEIRYIVEDETKKRQQEAYRRERLVFDRDELQYQKLLNLLNTEYQVFRKTLMEKGDIALLKSRLVFLKNSKWYPHELVKELSQETNSNFSPEKLADFLYRNYVILESPPSAELLREVGQNAAVVRTRNTREDAPELIRDVTRFLFKKDWSYQKFLAFHAFQEFARTPVEKLWFLRSIELFVEFQVFQYNETQTQARKEAAKKAVLPVTAVLPQGLYILRNGDVVDRDSFEKLEILRTHQEKMRIPLLLGNFIILSITAFGAAFFMYRFAEFSLRDLSSHLILHSLLLKMIFLAFFLEKPLFSGSGVPLGLSLPVAYFSIMSSLLLGIRVTVIAGTFLVVFLFLFSGEEAITLLFGLMALFTGSYTAERMQKRTQFLKGAVVIALCNSILLWGYSLIHNQKLSFWENQVFFVIINAFASVILTVVFLPIYENIFNLATKFRLIELSDVNNPLLRQLASVAPSTYSHSLMMANLSEKAVLAIGGDVLLTRVGCLYHDIGKMKNPQFYAENKHLSPTNEDFKKWGPIKSAQMIISHVTDGIAMARKYRLPEKVISFIPEHHGTTTIQYFYHQALAQENEKQTGKVVPKSLFQYPGPRPRSRETAVVMIADSVEAASRSLPEVSKESFSKLIDEIIENKIAEDQFDESGLTLYDLKKIKEAFLQVLLSHYHNRPPYPKMQETRNLEIENARLLSKTRNRERNLQFRSRKKTELTFVKELKKDL